MERNFISARLRKARFSEESDILPLDAACGDFVDDSPNPQTDMMKTYLEKYYGAEHLRTLDDTLNDLKVYCKRHGGTIR